MSDKNCTSCGAIYSEGLVCQYCGRATSYFNSLEDENRALDELHNLLQSLATEKSDLNFEEMDKRNARAAKILEKSLGLDHPTTQAARRNLEILLAKLGSSAPGGESTT